MCPKFLFASALLVSIYALSAAADEAPRREVLRFLDGESPKAAVAAVPGEDRQILAERQVAIDFSALKGFPRLPLLDGRIYDLERGEIERRGAAGFAWRGKVIDPSRPEAYGTATFTVMGDLMAGLVVMPDAVYEIEPLAGEQSDGHRIIQVESPMGTCGGAVAPDVAVKSPRERQAAIIAAEAAAEAAAQAATQRVTAAEPSRLDLLALWTPSEASQQGGIKRIRLIIQNAVDVANTAYINSRINTRLNLVHARQIDYSETGDPETDLFWLKNDKTIASLRKSVGADVVSLFLNRMLGACGIGFLMTNDAFSKEFSPWTYSTVKRACGALVLAHEVGHNLGSHHDRPNSGNADLALFPFAFGHIVEGQFRTVMAYGNNCSVCPWVEHFSNPEVTRNGVATGVAGQADNARVHNATYGLVSTFQTAQPCKPGPNNLCLLNKRFRVELVWENQFNQTQGLGTAISRTDAAGFFTFGDASNIELMVKMLDFGNVIKVFYGQLTNLKFSLIVTDTQTGASKIYENAPKECGAIDQAAFSSASTLALGTSPSMKSLKAAAGSCKKDKNTLCLLGNRFQVKVDWRNPGNNTSGSGGAVAISSVTGAFYFTDAGNLELMAKIIDYGSRIDFFYGTLSDLEYTLTVTDTSSGQVKTYQNPAGNFCGGLDDSAFPR
ncbi:MAG TPA: zinc-dependent metalloprotease family protein [Thermoanaerobaculia bacterium]|nr:zinc-dependent metalloprotease family protein [Thermoanaerobaculia bacterium]